MCPQSLIGLPGCPGRRSTPVQAVVPVADRSAPQAPRERAGREEGAEGNGSLAARLAFDRKDADADERAVEEAKEEAAEHVLAAEPAERQPENERQAHVAEAHA